MSDDPKPMFQDDVESGSWMTENGHLIVPIENDIEHVEEEEDVRPSTSYSNKQCIEFKPTTMEEEEADSSDSVDDDEDWLPPSQKKLPKSPSIPESEPTTTEEQADSSDSIDDDDDWHPPSQKTPRKSPSFRGRRRARPPKTIQNNRSPTYYPDYPPKDYDFELSEVPVTKFPHANKLGGDGQTEKSLSLRFYEQYLKDQVDKGRVLNRTHIADQIALEYRVFNARREEQVNFYKGLQSICNGEELHEGMDKKTLALIIYAEFVKRKVCESLKKEGKFKDAISFISSLKLQREPQVIKKRKRKCEDHNEFLKNPETNAFGLTDGFFDGLPNREDIERHCSDIWNNSQSSEDVNQAGGSFSMNNRTVSINGKRTKKERTKKVKSLTSEEYTVSEFCCNETDSNKIGSVFKAGRPFEVNNKHIFRLSAEDASRVLNTSSISNVQRNTHYYISSCPLMSNKGMIHESEANQQTENTKVVDPNTKVEKLEESSFVQNNIVEEALESVKLENLKDTKLLKQRPIAPNDEVPTRDAKRNREPIVVLERLYSPCSSLGYGDLEKKSALHEEPSPKLYLNNENRSKSVLMNLSPTSSFLVKEQEALPNGEVSRQSVVQNLVHLFEESPKSSKDINSKNRKLAPAFNSRDLKRKVDQCDSNRKKKRKDYVSSEVLLNAKNASLVSLEGSLETPTIYEESPGDILKNKGNSKASLKSKPSKLKVFSDEKLLKPNQTSEIPSVTAPLKFELSSLKSKKLLETPALMTKSENISGTPLEISEVSLECKEVTRTSGISVQAKEAFAMPSKSEEISDMVNDKVHIHPKFNDDPEKTKVMQAPDFSDIVEGEEELEAFNEAQINETSDESCDKQEPRSGLKDDNSRMNYGHEQVDGSMIDNGVNFGSAKSHLVEAPKKLILATHGQQKTHSKYDSRIDNVGSSGFSRLHLAETPEPLKTVIGGREKTNSKDFQVDNTTSSKSSRISLVKTPGRFKPVIRFELCDD